MDDTTNGGDEREARPFERLEQAPMDADRRLSMNAVEGTGVGRPDLRDDSVEGPEGHRQGDDASDAQIREAGQNR